MHAEHIQPCMCLCTTDCYGLALKILARHDSCTIYHEQRMYFPAKGVGQEGGWNKEAFAS